MMHPEARAFVAAAATRLPPGPVVELGSRDFNGTIRDLFAGAPSYVGVDLAPGAGVDVVADAADWRPAAGEPPAETVLCCEVLEHTPRGGEIVRNAWALLAPGGHLVVTAAAPRRPPHSATDGGALRPGEFYRNVQPPELRGWLEEAGFTVARFEEHPDRGDVYAVARKGAR